MCLMFPFCTTVCLALLRLQRCTRQVSGAAMTCHDGRGKRVTVMTDRGRVGSGENEPPLSFTEQQIRREEVNKTKLQNGSIVNYSGYKLCPRAQLCSKFTLAIAQ